MTFHDHFSGHATTYREARPSYPEALFDWLATQTPARDLVWDAGCGNGQASVALSTSVTVTPMSTTALREGTLAGIALATTAAWFCQIEPVIVPTVGSVPTRFAPPAPSA